MSSDPHQSHHGEQTCCSGLGPSGNPSSSGMAHLLPDEFERCPKVPFVGKQYLFVYLGALGL